MNKKTILIVDDTPHNIDLLVGLLQDTYTVKAAINGELALRIAQSPEPPDLILLDIVMPGMDGFEVCGKLKANEKTKHIPIVFLSGNNSEKDRERGLGLGGEAYLAKPVDSQGLFSVLETSLSDN